MIYGLRESIASDLYKKKKQSEADLQKAKWQSQANKDFGSSVNHKNREEEIAYATVRAKIMNVKDEDEATRMLKSLSPAEKKVFFKSFKDDLYEDLATVPHNHKRLSDIDYKLASKSAARHVKKHPKQYGADKYIRDAKKELFEFGIFESVEFI